MARCLEPRAGDAPRPLSAIPERVNRNGRSSGPGGVSGDHEGVARRSDSAMRVSRCSAKRARPARPGSRRAGESRLISNCSLSTPELRRTFATWASKFTRCLLALRNRRIAVGRLRGARASRSLGARAPLSASAPRRWRRSGTVRTTLTESMTPCFIDPVLPVAALYP
jgi:hypothetical protein